MCCNRVISIFQLRQTIKRRFLVKYGVLRLLRGLQIYKFDRILLIAGNSRRLQSALDRSRSQVLSPLSSRWECHSPLQNLHRCQIRTLGACQRLFMCVFWFRSTLYSDPPFFVAASAFGRKCVDHDTEESHRKREKPLVPKYQIRDPKFVQSVNVSCSLQFHLNACFNLYHDCVQLRTQLSICLSRYVSISHGDISGEVLARGVGAPIWKGRGCSSKILN